MNNIIAFTTLMTLANTFASGTTNGFCGVAQSQIEIRFQVFFVLVKQVSVRSGARDVIRASSRLAAHTHTQYLFTELI